MLQVENVHLSFRKKEGFLRTQRKQVLKGATLQIYAGECLGLVGESGSGKSTLGRVICGLARPDSGIVRLAGDDIYHASIGKNAKQMRGKVSIVFQDYNSSVNPYFTVQEILEEPLRGLDVSTRDLESLLEDVRLPASYLSRLPHELSGGELQRICIARALAAKPQLLLLDEAVSSLDVSVQFQVLELLKTLKKERNLSYLFISHDLAAVTYLCDRVIFFNDGHVVEKIDRLEDLVNVQESYSRQLLSAVLT